MFHMQSELLYLHTLRCINLILFQMNKNEIAQQDTNRRVSVVLLDFGVQVSSIPLLASSVPGFVQLTGNIDTLALEAKSISQKPGTNKQKLRADLQEECLSYGKTAMVYARSIKDEDGIVNILTVKHDILSLNDYNFALYGKYLVNYSVTHAEGLLNVGLTAEVNTELSLMVTAFDEHMEEPREDINKRKDLNMQLEKMIKESSDALADVFDGLVERFPTDDPFYIAYHSARIVNSPATRHKTDEDDSDE